VTSVEVLRLLWLVENFFDYEGRSYHEVALYFLDQIRTWKRSLEHRGCLTPPTPAFL
jgi:hypothetical protein